VTTAERRKCTNALKVGGPPAEAFRIETSPAEEARMDEETKDAEDAVEDVASLDQPEDEATEHALRLMDEALRRNDAGRRWLVAGDP
jgi:hypothetical protein